MLTVLRSGYYRWKSAGPCKRERDDATSAPKVAEAHRRSRRTYGAPRVMQELREQGVGTSKRRCARLLKALGLKESTSLLRQTAHHRQPARPGPGAQSPCATLAADRSRPGVGDRHHLHRDRRRLAVSGCHPRSLESPHRRLGLLAHPARRPRPVRLATGAQTSASLARAASSLRPRRPIRLRRLRRHPGGRRDRAQHEPCGQLLRQRRDGVVLEQR